ncbi:hypothetical protein KEJ19_03500 [Candidatus Bathyarchaeota archaeon]|nr:hypothetical protein [Candidatus Bathyarchaeota archaeon]
MDCLRAQIPEAPSLRAELDEEQPYVTAYLFLRKLKLRKGKLWHKDYRIVADRAPWYGIK